MFIASLDFWGPSIGIDSAEWTTDNPADVNYSRYGGTRSVVVDPWHTKLYGSIALQPIADDAGQRKIRSFLRRAKGVTNTFAIYATPKPQNGDAGVTLAADAAGGATSITLAGWATALLDGEYLTINGQLCMCFGDQDGDEVTLDPPLREAAAAGTTVETSRPYAVVAMTSSTQGYKASGVVHGVSFDVEEAVLEHPDGSLPTVDSVTLTWDSITSTWDMA